MPIAPIKLRSSGNRRSKLIKLYRTDYEFFALLLFYIFVKFMGW